VPYTYDYPRPALTADCVVFGFDDEDLKVLLIQRDRDPFAGQCALPGGFVEMDETLDEAARRELKEEAGLSKIFLEQLHTFGDVHRDPRGRVVTVAYYALVNIRDHRVRAASDARKVGWFPVAHLPNLAFDHDEIIKTALDRLKFKVRFQPIGLELLPKKFNLSQLQHLYEKILARPLDKQDFRRKVLATGLLVEADEGREDSAHRSARLYRFDRRRYWQLTSDGVLLDI
jgi:8-oxo-dGTP diphosphatase